MSFDVQAWQQAKRENRAPQWRFKDLDGVHHTFGDALANHAPFLDYYVRKGVEEILADFRPFEEAWRQHGFEAGQAEYRATLSYGQVGRHEAERRAETVQREILNDVGARAAWVRARLLDRIEDLKAEIRSEAAKPDCPWRASHPVEGVYSRGRNLVLPLVALGGFCPKCHEPLTRAEDVKGPARTGDGWAMACPACRSTGRIDDLEDRHGHRFHLLPFTDIPLRDFVHGAVAA